MMDFNLSVKKTALPVDPFEGIDLPQASLLIRQRPKG